MTKPTILQTLLGRPSQKYSFPREKEYHSAKRDLLRYVAEQPIDNDDNAGHREEPVESNREVPFVGKAVSLERDFQSTSFGACHEPIEVNPDNYLADPDDDTDVFYTPDTSPRMSMLSTTTSVSSPPLAGTSLPYNPNMTLPIPSTSTTSLVSSSDSLISAPSLASFASLPHTGSTRLTTPVGSDIDHTSSTTKQYTSSVYDQTRPRHTSLPYPDAAWSKNVRWLAPPTSVSPSPTVNLVDNYKPNTVPNHSRAYSTSTPPSYQPTNKKLSKSIAKGTPSIRTSMTVLLEEDERDPYMNFTPPLATHRRHSIVQTPRSSVIVMEPRLRVASSPAARSEGGEQMPKTYSRGSSPSRPNEMSSHSRSSSFSAKNQDFTLKKPYNDPFVSATRPHRRSSLNSSVSASIPPSTSYNPSLPSQGTPGYTSLTLPRAPPPASLSLALATSHRGGVLNGAGGHVDLTRSGIAQTTMASVEVVKGLGARRKGNWGGSLGVGWVKRGGLDRRRTVSGSEYSDKRGTDDVGKVSGLKGEVSLGFTGHREPPGYVDAGSVLVQVWTVGVDGVDERLVSGKGKEKADVGFTPGRSFIGRVLECGWEVKEEDAKKGEWVIGLLDVRKCGVLAEFIVVDRHRIQKVPYPHIRLPLLTASALDSLPANSRPNSPSRSSTRSRKQTTSPTSAAVSLSLEEYSLLPLCGIPAYRAFRTFIIGLSNNFQGKSREKGCRALVLRGHDGAGGMVVQMLARRGWSVYAHAPKPSSDEKKRKKEIEGRVRAWGAEAVVFDDGAPGAAVRIMEGLMEDGEEFNVVLDTVGGRDVWEAGERLLRSGDGGIFTTLVGDTPERAIPSVGDNFKAGLRSLKLGNRRVGEKSYARRGKVGYVWVSVAQDVDWEGEDVRDSLRAVLGLALDGGVRPRVGSAVPFEKAPEAFFKDGREKLRDGGTVVVSIVE